MSAGYENLIYFFRTSTSSIKVPSGSLQKATFAQPSGDILGEEVKDTPDETSRSYRASRSFTVNAMCVRPMEEASLFTTTLFG